MMNPDFLRLAILGNARAAGRLAAVFFGIAMGMALIVLLVGAFDGLLVREERSAWIKPAGEAAMPARVADGKTAVIAAVEDWFAGRAIKRIDVYAPPGAASPLAAIPVWPGPDEYYASPALAALIDAMPPEQLGDRYGKRIGLIGDAFLKGPDSLALVAGQKLEVMLPRAGLILAASARGRPDTENSGFRTVAAVGAIGMLFPVLLFVAIATKLGAASRRETFSTLRLIGATPFQVGMVAGLETLLVSIAGTACGALVAVLLRPAAAQFEAVGARFYPADLDIGPETTLLIAATIVAAATLVSAIGMRRARIGPLGAARAMAEKPVSERRLLPLLAGLGLIFLSGRPEAGIPEDWGPIVFLAGFAAASLGIVVVGPWLTALAGRVIARASGTATGVIVANRIAAAPVATFRSVSGLVLAVFMVTVFSAASAGVSARFADGETANRMPVDALLVLLADGAAVPAKVAGASRLVTGYAAGGENAFRSAAFSGADLKSLGVTKPLDGDAYYRIDLRRFVAASTAADLDPVPVALPGQGRTPHALIARTTGGAEAIETARTALQTGLRWAMAPMTRHEANLLGANRALHELSVIAYSGALITILISGLSLTVSTLGAIVDRKRVFGLMRLVGMPAQTLDRVVFLEAAVPLAAVLVFSILAGHLGAWLIVKTMNQGMDIGAPDGLYFGFLAAGLAGALVILQLAKRVVRHMIDGETVRFE